MANHLSAKKRIRQSEKRRLLNKFYAKTTRNAIKKLYSLENQKEANELFPKVSSMIDRLVKKSYIHKNKAANLKSKLALHIGKLDMN